MKISASFVLFIVLLSSACSFKIFSKVEKKADTVKEEIKNVKQNKIKNVFSEAIDKKLHVVGHKNVSHGFVPSQIKCKCSPLSLRELHRSNLLFCRFFVINLYSHSISKMRPMSERSKMCPRNPMSSSLEDVKLTPNV